MDNDNGAALYSPEKSGGIGTISFYYRNWSSPAINFFIYTSANSKEPINIAVIHALGKVVYTNKVNADYNTVLIDVNKFENGVYSLIVSNEYFTTT